ncbi:MAG: DNA-binding transcriptional MerR regulator [Sphingobacteriales bacterium]|jgi:DNA-binding transcriptional MerR regulator
MGVALREGRMFYSIKEVSEHFDLNQSTLRFWEKEFPQLHPKKNTSGRRKYTPEDVQIIGKIIYLVRKRGYTLSGAKDLLDKRVDNEDHQRLEVAQKLEEIRAFLLELKDHL